MNPCHHQLGRKTRTETGKCFGLACLHCKNLRADCGSSSEGGEFLLEDNGYDNYESDIGSVSSEESLNAKKNRKGSLVKKIVESNQAVCISLDLEHGGDKCGVTQLSAVLFRLGGFEKMIKGEILS